MAFSQPVTDIPGVGPALAAKLLQLGIKNIDDVITYWPRRYDDYSTVTTIDQLQPGPVTICGTIGNLKSRYARRGMHITEGLVHDATGSVRVMWFNQPYRAQALKADHTYYVAGSYELSHQRFGLQNPTVELAEALPLNTARIVPIYRETKGITSKQIRSAVSGAFTLRQTMPETLPQWLVQEAGLYDYQRAVRAMHFPRDADDLAAARRRLGFEEVFELSLASQYLKREQRLERALPVEFVTELAQRFVKQLPFTLTDSQRRALWQIFNDIAQDVPMNRLLEGDVGAGKTVVAAMAGLMAVAQDFQVALMAPTELLARQHAETVSRLLNSEGFADTVCLLVGSLSTVQKQRARKAIKQGQARFIIGTQALIQETVDMHRLALVIIDEQHRFGVEQRKALMLKAGHMPHVLSMTATPIPRSLALTLYGELDVTVLPDKPAGRQDIITSLVSPNSQAVMFTAIEQQLKAGRQMFVVCPLIAESSAIEADSAEATYERLRKKELKQWRIGLLHGKLKPADKQAVMEQFVRHELDVLVATTVIEVGVDVPNASVMMIASPERFGLAQLHQLRGRIGRGGHQAYCYLTLSDSKAPSKRLQALISSNDGFRLSELDLELRGPGAIYGTMQHGALDLSIARLTDTALIAEAQKMAKKFIAKNENLLHYKKLERNVARLQTVTNLN